MVSARPQRLDAVQDVATTHDDAPSSARSAGPAASRAGRRMRISDMLAVAPARVPRGDDVQAAVPRGAGPDRARPHRLRVPPVLAGRRRAPALRPASAARPLHAPEGHRRAPGRPGRGGGGRAGPARSARHPRRRPRVGGPPPDRRRARPRGGRRAVVHRGPRRRRASCGRTRRARSTPGRCRSSSSAAALAEHGIDPRHLRQFRAAADRQADLVEQVVAPWRGQRSASSRARAGTLAAEVGELCTQMHTALLRAAVADLAP